MVAVGEEMPVDGVRLEPMGRVGTIHLARPPVNAFDERMLAALAAAVQRPTSWCPGARSLLLVADGPHFSAGHDRAEAELRHDPGFLARAVTWLGALAHAPLPLVTAVHGAAVGTGAIAAFTADLVVAEPDAQVALPEVGLGMLGGAGHAARWLPTAWVRRLVLTGASISGERLAALGAVLPPDDGLDARTTAQRLAEVLSTQPVRPLDRKSVV